MLPCSEDLYSNLYLDSMPLEYRARVFLERHSPCSGIAEPSLHVFQRRGMVKKCKSIIGCRVAIHCGVVIQLLYTYRYSIMRKCWRADPAQRPTFSELGSILDRFLQLVADYTELTMTLPAREADQEYKDVQITDHEGGRMTLYILSMS